MISFFVRVALSSLLIYIFKDSWFVHEFIWSIQALFVFIHLFSFTIEKALAKFSDEKLSFIFILFTVRFLSSLAYILIVSLKHPSSPKIFILNFCAFYLYYTVFEFKALMANLRANSKNGS